ncbi:MAG: 4'-phosphopantetheinyl transferase family protein [Bacilli bacterium]
MVDVYIFKNDHFGKNITLLNLAPLSHIFAYEELNQKLCSFSAYYFLENNHINVDFVNGKPIDKNGKFISLSHSSNLVAIAISDIDVGIDIEMIKPFNENLFDKVFSYQEKEEYLKEQNKDFFFQIWTKKEAYTKRIGTGLTCYPRDIDVNGMTSSLIISSEDKKYYLSISLPSEEKIEYHLLDGRFW